MYDTDADGATDADAWCLTGPIYLCSLCIKAHSNGILVLSVTAFLYITWNGLYGCQ